MATQPKYEPPKRSFKSFAFLLAALGLFLLVGALDALRFHSNGFLGGTLAVSAVALIILAVLCGKRKN